MRKLYRLCKGVIAYLRHQILKIKLGYMGPGVSVAATVILEYPERQYFAAGVSVGHRAIIKANGENVYLDEGCSILDNALLFANSGHIRVGKRSWVGAGSQLHGNGGISIGNDVMIAPMCVVNTVSHNADDISVPMNAQGLNTAPVTIEDDVWIGAGARILQGVTIGEGAIVGANSLVTQDVPRRAIVVGTPAKIKSYRGKQDPPIKVTTLKHS